MHIKMCKAQPKQQNSIINRITKEHHIEIETPKTKQTDTQIKNLITKCKTTSIIHKTRNYEEGALNKT